MKPIYWTLVDSISAVFSDVVLNHTIMPHFGGYARGHQFGALSVDEVKNVGWVLNWLRRNKLAHSATTGDFSLLSAFALEGMLRGRDQEPIVGDYIVRIRHSLCIKRRFAG